jgi:hypothetical protein
VSMTNAPDRVEIITSVQRRRPKPKTSVERFVVNGPDMIAARKAQSTTAVMTRLTRDQYLELRRQYEPTCVKLIIVAESPPASGRFFYNKAGSPNEPLFAAMMRHLGISPMTKESGLREFQKKGWILVDATYEPVNKLTDKGRDEVIKRDYPLLFDDLASLTPDRLVPVILIKANVCRLLEHKLIQDGFDVLNHGIAIPFPVSGRQTEFREKFSALA